MSNLTWEQIVDNRTKLSGEAPSANTSAPKTLTWEQVVDDSAQQDYSARAASMANSLSVAKDTSADAEARDRLLAQKTSVPLDTVKNDRVGVEQQFRASTYADPTFVEQTPVMAKYLTDPSNARLMQDDVETLRVLEKEARKAPTNPNGGWKGLNTYAGNTALAMVTEAGASASNLLFGAARGATSLADKYVGQPFQNVTGLELPFAAFNRGLTSVQQYLDSVYNYERGVLKPANLAEEALYAAGGSLGVAASAFASGGGAAVPTLAYMGGSTAGQGVSDALNQGLPVESALFFGARQGVYEAGLGAMPVFKLVKDLNIGSSLGKTFMHQVMTEMPSELLTTLAQNFDTAVTLNPEKPISDFINELPHDLAVTALSVFGVAGAMSGVGKLVAPKARQEEKASEGQQSQQIIQKINEVASTAKLRTLEPDTFNKLIGEQVEGTHIENLYVNSEVLFQSDIDPLELAKLSPTAAEQIGEAKDTGAMVRIPTSEYAAYLQGTPTGDALQQHLKTDPDGFSAAEMEDFKRTQSEQVKAEVEKVLTQKQQQDASMKSQLAVEKTIAENLNNTRRFDKSINKDYAKLQGAIYATMGERLGLTAEEMYQRFPLQAKAESFLGKVKSGRLFSSNDATIQRGFYDPATNTIGLLKHAKLATFLHETGHMNLRFLEVASKMPEAKADVKGDYQTVIDWFGIEGATPLERTAKWEKMTADEQRQHHEKFAEEFEKYLAKGKAPSVELENIFRRFADWLKNLYKAMVASGQDVSPEIKGVFDRMLASEAKIEEKTQVNMLKPLLDTGDLLPNVTEEEYQAYHKDALLMDEEARRELDSRLISDMKWLTNAKGKELQRQKKEVEAKRKAAEEEVTREVDQIPVYRVLNLLKKGEITTYEGDNKNVRRLTTNIGETGRFKLSLPILKQIYGQAPNARWRELSTGKYGLAATEGLDPHELAAMFGFNSADHMVQEILKAKDRDALIQEMTDVRLFEKYGDITSPEEFDRAAEKAIRNRVRERFLMREVNMLAKAVGAKRLLAEAAKSYAGDVVGRTKVKDLRPRQFVASEVKEARLAEQAFKKGDLTKAAIHKRNQVIHHMAAAEALKVSEELAKHKKYFDKFNKKDSGKAISYTYNKQITVLLEKYGLKKTSANHAQSVAELAQWAQGLRDDGLEVPLPDDIFGPQRDYKTLTVSEARNLYDNIRTIEHLGKNANQLFLGAKQQNIAQAADEMATAIKENAVGKVFDTRTRPMVGNKLSAIANFASRFNYAQRDMVSIAYQMDGLKDGGPVWSYIGRTANERAAKQAEMMAEDLKQVKEILKPIITTGENYGGEGIYYPKLGASLNQQERLMMAVHMGNPSNKQRLLDGYGWKEEDVQEILDTFTPEETKFVEDVWAFTEKHFEEANQKHRRLYNTDIKKIEPSPVRIGGRELKGGYAPVKYDPLASDNARDMDADDWKNAMFNGSFNNLTTLRTYSKERVKKVTGRPLLLSFSTIERGASEIVHDICWHEWAIDTKRLISNANVSRAIKENWGMNVLNVFNNGIRDTVQGDIKGRDALEQAVAELRKGVTTAYLGWSVTTALLQPLGLFNTAARIGYKWTMSGARQFLNNPKRTYQNVLERSSMMRGRLDGGSRDISDANKMVGYGEMYTEYRYKGKVIKVPTVTNIASKVVGKKKAVEAKDFVSGRTFQFIVGMQSLADVITWQGQFEKSRAEGFSENDAAALADEAVIASQGSSDVHRLAEVLRGSEYRKMLTVFGSFFVRSYNIAAEANYKARRGLKESDYAGVSEAMLKYLSVFVFPVVATQIISAAKQAASGEEGEEDSLWSSFVNDEIAYIMGTTMFFRELTPAVQKVLGVEKYHGVYQGPAGLRLFVEMDKLATQISQGELDAPLRKSALNTAGILFKLPSAQINKSINGIDALIEGRTTNPLAPLVGAPSE